MVIFEYNYIQFTKMSYYLKNKSESKHNIIS